MSLLLFLHSLQFKVTGLTNILFLYLSLKYAHGRQWEMTKSERRRERKKNKKKVEDDDGYSASKSFWYKSPLINLHGGDKSSDMPQMT